MNLLPHLWPAGCTTALPFTSPPQVDLALGLPRQRLLVDTLVQAQRGANATDVLRMDLPPPGETRMRNLVHRGAPRPVFKTTSVKLGRVVQSESALEHEATLLLDVSPTVQSFAEQPLRIHYRDLDGWRSHIPDFAALVASRLSFIEIKFEKDVNAEVCARTSLLEEQLGALDVGYCVLTERHLRQGDNVQNALRVLRRARHSISEVHLLATLEKLRNVGQLPLSAFGWSIADSKDAVGIAQLIMSGHAAVESSVPISDRSYVWLVPTASCAGGGA